jgi:hypothetical protein
MRPTRPVGRKLPSEEQSVIARRNFIYRRDGLGADRYQVHHSRWFASGAAQRTIHPVNQVSQKHFSCWVIAANKMFHFVSWICKKRLMAERERYGLGGRSELGYVTHLGGEHLHESAPTQCPVDFVRNVILEPDWIDVSWCTPQED